MKINSTDYQIPEGAAIDLRKWPGIEGFTEEN